MINNRKLQTQPLDPSVVNQWESENRPLRVQATQPLTPPHQILGDKYAQNRPPQSEIPSASLSVSSALSSDISAADAELLLDVSAKLGDVYHKDKAVFAETMSALTDVAVNGRVDFKNISPRQQELLYKMGLTPSATASVYTQLHDMLLPKLQGETSSAFQSVQSHVNSFISNVDLKQHTMSQIESQAKDLTAVQGVVSSLSAGSIGALLADQTASVFDLGVSKINSSNFAQDKGINGMDYTLGHFALLSQESPQTLQQVEGILKKVKTDNAVSPNEKELLNKFGLNLNAQNKLETYDKKVISFDNLKQLETVAFSMTDPTEGYSKVLQSSAAIISQNEKFQALTQQMHFQAEEVATTAKSVAMKDVILQQTQASANNLNVKLQQAQVKAYELQQVADMAVKGQDLSILSPAQLGQMGIQVVGAPGTMAPPKVYIQGREASHGQLLQHINTLLVKETETIQKTSKDLTETKTEVVVQSQDLAVTTDDLVAKKTELNETRQLVAVEKLKLEDLVLVRDKTVNEFFDLMTPEEQEMVKERLNPVVDSAVQQSVADYEKVIIEVEQVIVQAQKAIDSSLQTQASVSEDIAKWEKTLKASESLLKDLQAARNSLEKELNATPKVTPSVLPKPEADIDNKRIYQSPEKPLLFEDEIINEPLKDRAANADAAKMLEDQFLDKTQREKHLAAQEAQEAQVTKRIEAEKAQFKTEQNQRLDD